MCDLSPIVQVLVLTHCLHYPLSAQVSLCRDPLSPPRRDAQGAPGTRPS